MKLSGKIFILMYITLFVAASLQADPGKGHGKGYDGPHDNLPPGLHKKVHNGGDLPPGWQKKLRKGERIDYDILIHGHEVRDGYRHLSDTVIYQVGDRIFRIAQDTREILEILR